ncbi:MAG: NAD(P)/FAD-dependent oxidoreductase, partial [Candidatus Omnitrophota bacterium]|nr:NAD(P)/FAD-dependent oxidoreductase [Candidatus Omnitrophota bacterium]
MSIKKIVVVGGGPAGMMAAIRAAQLKQEVTLLEKNPVLGKKLLLSGKGRCNLTNSCDLDSFLQRFSGNAQFLRGAFKKFFNRDLMDFFQKRGLRLKVERQRRVFPVSDRSDSVLEVLKGELVKNKVRVLYKIPLKDILVRDGEVKGARLSDGDFIAAERIILATGGISYGFSGSSGEGLELARKLGHTITPLSPGLVALRTEEKYPFLLKGLTLKNIRLKFSEGKRKITSDVGELLFTDSGISGPLVLTLSGRLIDWLSGNKKVFAEIDLKPALSAEKLDSRLLKEFSANPKKSLKNTLKKLLPQRLIGVFMDICAIDPHLNAAHLRKEQRRKLSLLLKGLPLNIIGSKGIEEAMITRGGVSLKDIDPQTMQSCRVKGLYFCGEMIDLDA